jgi:hypothetical protein
MIAFASYNHNLIANAMVMAFQEAGVQDCRYWTLALDVQGVMISMS